MKYFKKLYFDNKYFFNSVLLIFLLLVLILNLFDLGFSGSKTSDKLAPVWLFITDGGGVYGIAVSFLIFAGYVLYNFKENRISIILFLAVVFLFQLINTGITYFILKDSIEKMRPSQLYITDGNNFDPDGLIYFNKSPEEKKKYLKHLTDSEPEKYSEIYPPVMYDWINETENSFPSGHSQSSFFIAVIFAFVISCTVPLNKIYLSVVPLLWAMLVSLSRVVIGVHYNIDVIAGAVIGIITAIIIISVKKFNVLFKC